MTAVLAVHDLHVAIAPARNRYERVAWGQP